jgi:hypothetical protein
MKLKAGNVIEVFGWVMLEGVPAGKYKILSVGEFYGRETYTFARPRGKKPLIRHYASSVDAWVRPAGHEDLNRIEVLG